MPRLPKMPKMNRAVAGKSSGGRRRSNKTEKGRRVVKYTIGQEIVYYDPGTGQYYSKNGGERILEHHEKKSKRKAGETHVNW